MIVSKTQSLSAIAGGKHPTGPSWQTAGEKEDGAGEASTLSAFGSLGHTKSTPPRRFHLLICGGGKILFSHHTVRLATSSNVTTTVYQPGGVAGTDGDGRGKILRRSGGVRGDGVPGGRAGARDIV